MPASYVVHHNQICKQASKCKQTCSQVVTVRVQVQVQVLASQVQVQVLASQVQVQVQVLKIRVQLSPSPGFNVPTSVFGNFKKKFQL